MRELEKMIIEDGKLLDGDVLIVGNFLNQNIDIKLLRKMAKEVHDHFNTKVDKIMTIEASGLPFATAIALEYDCDMIFAKKSATTNLSGNVYKSGAFSYTHQQDFEIFVNGDYLKKGDNVLIVDDFLACGNAFNALLDIANQAKLNVIGFASEIEKVYQNGGKKLRDLGYDVFSLAMIEAMENGKIIFKK